MSPRRKTTEEKSASVRTTLDSRSSPQAEETVVRPDEPIISAPPRPIRQKLPADVFVAYDAGMRVRASDLYRLLQQGPVPIAPDYPQVVTWMRARGVRIKTRMSTEGSFYELESDVPVPS